MPECGAERIREFGRGSGLFFCCANRLVIQFPMELCSLSELFLAFGGFLFVRLCIQSFAVGVCSGNFVPSRIDARGNLQNTLARGDTI